MIYSELSMWKTQKKAIFVLILKHRDTQTKSRLMPALLGVF